MDKILDKVIQNAKGYDTECSFNEYSTYSFKFEDTSITDSFFKKNSGLGISLGRDSKFGYSYSNLENWEDCLKLAKQVHKSSDKIPYFGIQKKITGRTFNLDHLKNVDFEKEVKDVTYLIKQYGKDVHIKSSFGFGSGVNSFKNSNNQAVSFKRSSVGFYVSIHKKEFLGSDYLSSFSLFEYEKIFKNALNNFEMSKNIKKIKSGQYDLVFDYDAANELISNFITSFFGTRKQEKTSFLGDKLNQLVFDSKLNIVDDGITKVGVRSSPFDNEGTPSQRTVLVKNGVVKNFLYDFNSACRENVKSTGSCGSISRKPSISSNNIIVKKGDGLKIKDGDILVKDLIGTHMLNPISGDFTLQIEGFIKEKGKYYRAKDIMASGNMFKMFGDIELGNEEINKGSSAILPKIKFKNVHVIA